MNRRAFWAEFAQSLIRNSPFLVTLLLLAERAGASFSGIPDATHYFSYHPDELFLLLPSFGFAHGDWNPHFFNYGTLYIYLVGIPAVAFNVVPGLATFPDHLAPLYVLGRHVTTAMAAGGVAVLYVGLTKERQEWWFASLSALFLALSPLYVAHAGYATVDVPATFWLVLSFALGLSACRRQEPRLALAAAVAVGFAAATKYNAGLFLLPLLATPYLERPTRPVRTWWIAVPLGAAIGFVIGCPYFWTPEFARGLLFEARHMRIGGTVAFVDTGAGWIYHLTHGLPVGLGYPLLGLSLLGLPLALALPRRSTRLAALWVLVYFAVIGLPKERFIRYLIPLTPFLAVVAAAPLLWLLQRSRPPAVRFAGVALTALVALTTLLYTSGQLQSLVDADPREMAYRAVEGELGASERFRHVGLIEAPWYLDPPVSPYNAGPFPPSRALFDQWNEAHDGLVAVTGVDAARLRAGPPDLFFISEQGIYHRLRIGDREAVEFASALEDVYRQVRVFRKSPSRFSWLAPGREWAPPDWLYDSPRIVVYYSPRR